MNRDLNEDSDDDTINNGLDIRDLDLSTRLVIYKDANESNVLHDTLNTLESTEIELQNNCYYSNESIKCSICVNNLNNNDICRQINRCKHIFHNDCLNRWLYDHNTCPVCRFNLSSDIINNSNTENNNTENNIIENNNDTSINSNTSNSDTSDIGDENISTSTIV